MWARVIESMIGCWLAMSPFIFRYDKSATFLWATHYICAFFIMLFAFGSFRRSLNKLHLLQLLIATYLLIVALAAGTPPLPAPYQNYVAVSALLFSFAVLPCHCSHPTPSWQHFYDKS